MKHLFVLVLSVFVLSFGNEPEIPAATTIAGSLPAKLTLAQSPFIATADIVVPAGETVVMDKGVVIHFKNFTGLIIRGTLIAEGTENAPVIFTSEHDRESSGKGTVPAPYDWNGITVEEGGVGSLFRNCHIRYSLFGINATTEFIVIDKCIFRDNGRADVTIKGVRYMTGTEPFSYLTYQGKGKTLIAYGTDISDELALRRIGRFGGAALFVTGVLVGTLEAKRFREANRQLKELSDVEKYSQDPDIIRRWENVRIKRDRHLSAAVYSYTFAGIGAVGIVLSYTIKY